LVSFLLAVSFGVGPAALAEHGSPLAEHGSPLAEHGSPKEPRPTMVEILAQIRVILPFSLSDEAFSDPADRAQIGQALNELAASAELLETHGRGREAGFASLSESLADDARTIARRYSRGETRSARFLLHRSLGTCVSCHSKIASPNESAMGRQMLAEIELADLSARERARLQVVARQFGEALTSYEELFASQQESPDRMAADGDFLSYLKICLTIENDADRATAALLQLRQRDDLSSELAKDVGAWLRSIAELQRAPRAGEALDRAGALLRAGEALTPALGDAAGLVYNIEAWHELQRLVDSSSGPSPELARAYYLLGYVESRLFGDGWPSGAEAYLEASIRMAPSQAFAREAYALLEELVVLGYTGSSGTHLPDDVRRELKELEEGLAPAAPPVRGAP
jgi:hypothetical protein